MSLPKNPDNKSDLTSLLELPPMELLNEDADRPVSFEPNFTIDSAAPLPSTDLPVDPISNNLTDLSPQELEIEASTNEALHFDQNLTTNLPNDSLAPHDSDLLGEPSTQLSIDPPKTQESDSVDELASSEPTDPISLPKSTRSEDFALPTDTSSLTSPQTTTLDASASNPKPSVRIHPGRATTACRLHIYGSFAPSDLLQLEALFKQYDFGFRYEDLSPQLESGHIRIPGLSEYSALIITHALRGLGLEFVLEAESSAESSHATPSPQSWSQTASTRNSSLPSSEMTGADESNPDHILLCTNNDQLPFATTGIGEPLLCVMSIPYETNLEERDRRTNIAIERLKAQLRHKAHFRGLRLITDFEITIEHDALHSNLQITAKGTAWKHSERKPAELAPTQLNHPDSY